MHYKSLSLILLLSPLLIIGLEEKQEKSLKKAELKIMLEATKDAALKSENFSQESLRKVTQMEEELKSNNHMLELIKFELTKLTQQPKQQTKVEDVDNSSSVLNLSQSFEEGNDTINTILKKVEFIELQTKNCKKEPWVKHTIVLSSDLKKLDKSFNEVETLGGISVKCNPTDLEITERDLTIKEKQGTAGWDMSGKIGRTQPYMADNKKIIPECWKHQIISDVNFTIQKSMELLEVPTTKQTGLESTIELRDKKMPEVKKITQLIQIGVTKENKSLMLSVHGVLEKLRNEILEKVWQINTQAADWLDSIAAINNSFYQVTRKDGTTVGAFDDLNYQNLHLLTALVVHHKNEQLKAQEETKKKNEAPKSNNNDTQN